jgi:carbonic anhydrase/acetyltransferase-like protein (isoleucine patch superfamily)
VIARLGERRPELLGNGHFIAASAAVIGSVRLGSRSSVWFNAVIRGDNDRIDIGERSNVQDLSILHTDPGIPLTVGDGVTIGHRVTLHGCSIGNHSLIGIASTILNGASIGSNCLVGAHALVTEGKHFPDNVLILGAPAKVARELDAKELALVRASADIYVANARRFSRDFAAE